MSFYGRAVDEDGLDQWESSRGAELLAGVVMGKKGSP
jgi:hypothetical protein